MNQLKKCPFCQQPSQPGCDHLALAAHGRDFVRVCIEAAEACQLWDRLCTQTRDQLRRSGEWAPDKEDFTWLETAFCERFLKRLAWFGGLDYEWRADGQPGKSGFCVLLWSRNPQRLWWDLRDEIERQLNIPAHRVTQPAFNPMNFVPAPQHTPTTGTLVGLVPGK